MSMKEEQLRQAQEMREIQLRREAEHDREQLRREFSNMSEKEVSIRRYVHNRQHFDPNLNASPDANLHRRNLSNPCLIQSTPNIN